MSAVAERSLQRSGLMGCAFVHALLMRGGCRETDGRPLTYVADFEGKNGEVKVSKAPLRTPRGVYSERVFKVGFFTDWLLNRQPGCIDVLSEFLLVSGSDDQRRNSRPWFR
jgi:hypothetical protein